MPQTDEEPETNNSPRNTVYKYKIWNIKYLIDTMTDHSLDIMKLTKKTDKKFIHRIQTKTKGSFS